MKDLRLYIINANVAHLKQQKTLMQCEVGCNSIYKSINNGFNHSFN